MGDTHEFSLQKECRFPPYSNKDSTVVGLCHLWDDKGEFDGLRFPVAAGYGTEAVFDIVCEQLSF